MNFKIKLISSIFILSILIITGIFYISTQAKGLSMNDGKEIADSIIISFNTDYLFLGASGHKEINNGLFSSWSYYYYLNSSDNQLEIEVFSNGNTLNHTYEIDNQTLSRINDFEVTQWSLDSPDAIAIASSNFEIKNFLNKYQSHIEQIQLKHPDLTWDSVEINENVWYIRYSRTYHIDDPKSAELYIDATTGEVLYVHADS